MIERKKTVWDADVDVILISLRWKARTVAVYPSGWIG
jgi:hypothetical protein